MPYSGNGVFVPLNPPVFPAVDGQTIRADYFNNTISDIIEGLNRTFTRDGQTALQGNLPMGGNRITGLPFANSGDQPLTIDQAGSSISSEGAGRIAFVRGDPNYQAGTVGAELKFLLDNVNLLNQAIATPRPYVVRNSYFDPGNFQQLNNIQPRTLVSFIPQYTCNIAYALNIIYRCNQSFLMSLQTNFTLSVGGVSTRTNTIISSAEPVPSGFNRQLHYGDIIASAIDTSPNGYRVAAGQQVDFILTSTGVINPSFIELHQWALAITITPAA